MTKGGFAMEKLAGRLVVVTIFIIVILGIYIFQLRGGLAKSQANAAAAMQNRDEFRHKLDDLTKSSNANTAALNTCTAALKDAQTQLEASTSKGRKR